MGAAFALRAVASLAAVLGVLLLGAWLVRRCGGAGTGRRTMLSPRRVEIVERVGIDPRRTLILIRRDGREHLLLIAPDGGLLVESGIVADARDIAAQEERACLAAEREQRAREAVARMRDEVATIARRGYDAAAPMIARWRGRRFHRLVQQVAPPNPATNRTKRKRARR